MPLNRYTKQEQSCLMNGSRVIEGTFWYFENNPIFISQLDINDLQMLIHLYKDKLDEFPSISVIMLKTKESAQIKLNKIK